MLDFELLRAFVAVADCGGFHRAAERLNLTQSTVSQQIKRFLLNDGRAVTDTTADADILDLQPHEIAAPEFAVDREVEQG
jgi:hypothetical protein